MSLENLKKGDTVILHMFTGCPTGVKTIIAADKKTITLDTRKGDMTFSKKTGKQISPKPSSEKYGNFITEDDGSFVPPNRKKKAEKAEKASKKAAKKAKAKQEEPEDDDEDDDEDYEEA